MRVIEPDGVYRHRVLHLLQLTRAVRVQAHPGASRSGAAWDGAVLHVRVTARAVEGAANRAVVQAVANALGVRRSAVRLVAGERSRKKLVEVIGLDPACLDRLREP